MNANRTATHKKRTAMLVVAGAAVILLLAGCQSSNGLVSSRTSVVCPSCTAETRLQPITGLAYTKYLCPSCKRVSKLDESTGVPMDIGIERYVGGYAGETVHVCDRCESVIEKCPVCRERQGT